MNPVTCPNCDARLGEPEQLDGWCETCGKALPPHVTAAAHKQHRHGRHRDEANPATPVAPAGQGSWSWRWWTAAGKGPK
jgi:hypothetical protein